MAVIVCRRCEQSTASPAKQCPHCGLVKTYMPEEETLMFKLTPLIGLVWLIGLLVMIFW